MIGVIQHNEFETREKYKNIADLFQEVSAFIHKLFMWVGPVLSTHRNFHFTSIAKLFRVSGTMVSEELQSYLQEMQSQIWGEFAIFEHESHFKLP